MAVGLDVLGGLQTELYGRVELAGDSQRELTVWIIACRELFAGSSQPHILRQASVAVADSACERQHHYLAHCIARPTESLIREDILLDDQTGDVRFIRGLLTQRTAGHVPLFALPLHGIETIRPSDKALMFPLTKQ